MIEHHVITPFTKEWIIYNSITLTLILIVILFGRRLYDDGKHYLQAYAVKNGELISTKKEHLEQFKGQIKFKVIADKEAYKLYFSTKGTHFNLFTSLDGSSLKSNGYTGDHLGIYATSNGKKTKDSASFEYVNYLTKKK